MIFMRKVISKMDWRLHSPRKSLNSLLEKHMNDVPLYRLYALRFVYLLLVLFLVSTIWTGYFHHTRVWPNMEGVARAVLAAIAVLAAVGIRYPLRMVPVLLLELTWKAIWLITVGLPSHAAGPLDADTADTFKACAVGVVLFALVIPWPYVFQHFATQQSDRWR
jgi:hypothetical protein